MRQGIIFDCDGTLVRSLDVGMASFNYAFEKLGEPPREAQEIKKFFGAGADRIFYHLLGDEAKALKAFEYYFEHESQNISNLSLHDGILDLLQKLKSKDIPLGIVTGRHFRDLELILKHIPVSSFFTAVICDNHLPKSKPAPDGILMAAAKMGVAVEHAFYVGDSVIDIKPARAARAHGIAALWDKWSRPEEMQNEGPVLLAHRPQDIWSYFE